MNKYKSFREQFKECLENRTRFEIISPWDGHRINICAKYKCVCNSGACRDERMKFDKNGFYTTKYLEDQNG